MFKNLLPVLMICFFSHAYSSVGTWHTFTSKSDVRALTQDQGITWAATSGGMFSFNQSSGAFEEFTTSEGLQTIDLTAITIDKYGTVWAGSANGFLHGYHPTTKTWEYISDLSLFEEPQKAINRLQTIGDTLFILSDVGVSIFSLSKLEFGDTYRRFGASPNQLNGNVTSLEMFRGAMYISTRSGIASTPFSNPNPTSPASWQVITSAQGLPSNIVKKIIASGDSILFIGTSNGLGVLRDSSIVTLVQGTTGLNITDLDVCPTCSPDLFFITSSQLWSYSASGGSLPQLLNGSFTSPLSAIIGDSLLGTQRQGLLTGRGATWVAQTPPGPPSNKFIGLAVDDAGIFFAGTGTSNAEGLMRFNGSTWRLYTQQTDPILGGGGNAAYQVDIGPSNSKWVSTFGAGVAVLDATDEIVKVLNASNGLPFTKNSSDNHDFCVVTGVAGDGSGNVWVNVRSANDLRLLSVYTPSDNSFRYIGYPVANNSLLPILTNIVPDIYGTFWFTTISDVGNESPGLVFYDPSKRLSGRLNDTTGWGVVREIDGLTDNQVSAVAVDNDGFIWVGSPQNGISIISDPLRPRTSILPYRPPLQSQKINDILVDPLNQKWIATDNGVFLFSPDGTVPIEHYTVTSTGGKLLDNKVVALTINRSTGTMYFGTEKGLSSLTTASVTPVRSFESLVISPNPLYLPSPVSLTIDGLMENSTLKILTIDGKLVREIKSPGGRIGFWDGRGDKGEFVASGIYIIIAVSEDGSKNGKGKVAVIRK